ncbi:HK97 family phage portal protein [Skermanella aerolata]|uniref:phage portal protein n=1 Tax=Skermanella aerolata TaxID=393310 RepID=UPI003D230C4F
MMGLLNRILGREERTSPLDPSWAALSGLDTTTGKLINARNAESLSACLGCVDSIGSALASLPAYVYRATDTGRTVEERHPLMRLIRKGPNAWQTWPDFVQWVSASVLLRGNALVEIVSDPRNGELRELRPIPWEHVSVQFISSTRRLAYDITDINTIHGGTGKMRRLLADEVVHLKDRSDDGLLGRSRLARAGAVVSAGLSLQHFVGAMFDNALTPSGVFQMDQLLSDRQRATIDERLKKYMGAANSRKTMILEAGMKYQPVSITPEDAELLASRRFSVEEIARIFQVPPPIIGDLTHGTFTNSETLIRYFATNTLSSWCRKIEAEFGRALLTDDDLSLELDLSGLLRGDPETRWKSHEIAIRNRVLLVNEVREMEGWGPIAGGDRYEPPPSVVAGGSDEG